MKAPSLITVTVRENEKRGTVETRTNDPRFAETVGMGASAVESIRAFADALEVALRSRTAEPSTTLATGEFDPELFAPPTVHDVIFTAPSGMRLILKAPEQGKGFSGNVLGSDYAQALFACVDRLCEAAKITISPVIVMPFGKPPLHRS